MANTLGNGFLNPAVWSKRMSLLLKKALVARDICNLTEREQLTVGDTVHRPYLSDLSVNTYTKGTAVTIQDIGATDETLVANQFKEVSFYVDEVDMLQNGYDVMAVQTDRAQYQLNSTIDSAVFAEYANFATTAITNANLAGGTGAAGAITASTSNIQAIFTTLKREMRKANVPMVGDTFIVVDPTRAELLERQFSAVGFSVADATLRNGFAGSAYGLQVYVSNDLTLATTRHLIGGRKGSIDLVVQMEPQVRIKEVPDKNGRNVLCLTVYGVKTFRQGALSLFDIQVVD